MEFQLKNTSAQNLTIRDMTFPVQWNSRWFTGGNSSDAYAGFLSNARNYVSYHGSYIMLERMDGGSSKVVLIMDSDTDASLEYRRYDQSGGYNSTMTEDFFIHSVGVGAGTTNGARSQSYLPNTQATINAGATKKYGFKIFHITDYADLHKLLHDQGLVSVAINPGTITPRDMETQIAVYSQTDVTITDGTPLPSSGLATWAT
jgi:hypothetical protein